MSVCIPGALWQLVAERGRSLNGRLLLHQRLGVMWMASLWRGQIRGMKDQPWGSVFAVQFSLFSVCTWQIEKAGKVFFHNTGLPPGTPQTHRFINGLKGGLLADESGLGKKVQVGWA